MIFPSLGPKYLHEKDRGILQRMESSYASSITINQSWWSEADLDTRYECNDQGLWNDLYGNLPANRSRQFTINRIRPIVNMIDGHQRRNRKSIVALPVDNSNSETSDQFSKIFMHLQHRENILETFSQAFRGALVTGMNLLQVWVDYRHDPIAGDIKVDCCSYNSFLIDPYFKKADLSDCNNIWKRTYVTRREAVSLMPNYADEILALPSQDSNKDGKFQFQPESFSYGQQGLITYDEYYYRDFRTQKLLYNTETGRTVEWKGQNDSDLKDYLKIFPMVTVIEQDIPTVKLAIIIQGKVFYHDQNPLGDNYPFVPVFCYYNPQMAYWPWRIQGVVRSMRDPQYLFNRQTAIMLDILESQVNSGWILKENVLVNPNDIFFTGQGKSLFLKSDANMTDIQRIQPAAVPPTTIQIQQLLGEEINRVSGVSEELTGADSNAKAGITEMLRQSAGLTGLQTIFDNADLALTLLGKIIMPIIQDNYTYDKVEKIIQAPPSNEFYSKVFSEYRVAVAEGLNTTTQRQMEMAQLLQLRELGVAIPDEILIEAATIQDKKKITDQMQQIQQQQMQMQQAQAQAAMQEQAARTDLAHARAMADRGLGAERASRIDENHALAEERRAAAVKDQEIGLLNLAKALKELDTMDIGHLRELITLANEVKAQEKLASEIIKSPGQMQERQSEAQALAPQQASQA